MSKYNNGCSIPVDSIAKEEIDEAIRGWAEGDNSMEELLWSCYSRGIKTNGCHAGTHPYISFNYTKELIGISKMMDATQKIKGSQILIDIAGNPFSGPEWYIPTIMLGFDTKSKIETDAFFDKLVNTLESNDNEEKKHLLFRFLDFFADKEKNLLFRFKHTLDDRFEFIIESGLINNNRYMYYNDIFTRAGLKETINPNVVDRYYWKLESNDLDDLSKRIDSAADYIINNYTVTLPQNEEEIIDFIEKALVMKRKLSEEEFKEWLEQKRR